MGLHRRAAHLLLLLSALGMFLPARGEAAGGSGKTPGDPCATPVLVRDAVKSAPLPSPSMLVDVGGTLYFVMDEAPNGQALWKTDGTPAGTVRVQGYPAWEASALLGHLTAVGSRLFFTVSTSANTIELWKSDGMAANTQPLKSFPSTGLGLEAEFVAMGNTLFFTANNGATGFELWKSNGSPAGTVIVQDLVAGSGSSSPSGLTVMNGKVYFSADNGTSGAELWRSDGLVIEQVKDIRAGSSGSLPSSLRAMGGVLYFTAADGTGFNATLWKSDGTDRGTVIVAPTAFDDSHDAPQELTATDKLLFFRMRDDLHGEEVWVSDGTSGGTRIARDILAGSFGSSPQQLTAVGNQVFFLANDGLSGFEPWRSDGTPEGTVLVRDFIPGSGGPFNPKLASGPGVLLAQINDGISGSELWKSDGTGTVRLTDINPLSASADPRDMTLSGGKLFFAAKDPAAGEVLFAIPLNEVDCYPPDLVCPTDQQVEQVTPEGAYFTVPPFGVFDDAVAPPTVTRSHDLEGLFPKGDTLVTLTAQDAAGNSQTCNFHVDVEDRTKPVLLCPKDMIQEATSAAGAKVNYSVLASDAVMPKPTVNTNHASGSLFPVAKTDIDVTASDGTNVNDCHFSVTVRDSVAPSLTCPSDVVLQATTADPIPITYKVEADDAITRPPELITEHPSGSLFPVGNTEVKITARDAAGNHSECSFWVRNVDAEAPTIACPGPQQVVASKPEGAVVRFPEATAKDNLDVTTVSYSQDPGSTFPVGETTVTATATDAGQNTASCTFTVTVLEGSGSGSASSGCQAGGSGASFGWWVLVLVPLWVRRRAVRLAR